MRWRKMLGWTAAVVGILLIAGIGGGLLFLRTESFQRLAIRTIVQNIDEATGSRSEIGKFDFQLSNLTAHLYDITVHGTEAPTQPPLLHVDELTVGLKIQSILHRRVNLSELVIQRPVAYVQVDRNGKSNIPPGSQKQSGGNVSVFDLAVGHARLSNGQITYNDKTIPVEANLYGLETELRFESPQTRYRGTISYASGSLRYGNDPVMPHSLDARFSATRNQLSLESAELKVGASSLSVHAELTNYSDPVVDGRYELRIHTQDFSATTRPVTPVGDISVSGKLRYQSLAGRPLLQSILLNGQIASEELAAASPEGRFSLRKLQGNFELANGSLQARDVSFDTFGGRISSDIKLEHLDSAASGEMKITLRGISLEAAQRSLRRAQGVVNVSGRADGTVEASWANTASKGQVRADVVVKSAADSGIQPSVATMPKQVIPVDAVIHAIYDGRTSSVTFRNTALRIPSANASLEGQVSNHSHLQIQANSSDLHGVMQLVSGVSGKPAPAEVAGSASLKALVQGSMQRPQLTGQVNAENLRVQGSEWRTAQASVQANPSQLALHNVVLVSAHQGKASLNGSVTLREWAYAPSAPIELNLSVQRLSIADLQRLANLSYPVSGDLSADISLHGSQLNPVGNGSAKIESAKAYGELIQHFAATFRADKVSATSSVEVSLPAGSVNGNISYTPNTKAYVVRLNAPALVLQKLHTLQAKNLGIEGTVAMSTSGQGTVDNPQLEALVELPHLQIRDKAISNLKGRLHVANQKAELALESEVAQASIHSHANVSLTGDYYAEATIDTTGVPLDPILAMYLPNSPAGFHGETELHATLQGPLKDKARIEAHVTIPVLKASYQSLEISAASPIRVDYANSLFTLQPADIRGTGTSLRVQGTLPLGGTKAPSLTAEGSVDVRILKIVDPDLESSGTITLNMHASGTADDPAVRGKVDLHDVELSTSSAPLGCTS